MTPVQIVASNLESDSYPHSYRSVIVAEYDETIIGMSLSFPGKYHKITDEMKSFFPHDRINHFKHFFQPLSGIAIFLTHFVSTRISETKESVVSLLS